MLELAVDGEFQVIVPQIVHHKVHVVYLAGVGIVDVLFHHLSRLHVEIFYRAVGRAILVNAQSETIVLLHTAIAYEDERTIVLVNLTELRILVDESRFSPAFVPTLREGCLVEMRTLLKLCHVEVVASRVKIMIGAHTDAPTLAEWSGDVGIDGVAPVMVD